MNVLLWIVFGILTGISMQSLFGEKKKNVLGEIISGVAGAILGGISSLFLISQSSSANVTVFSYILAFIGAFFFLFVFKIVSVNNKR